MSADTTPISPARFAAALEPLSLPTLRLKTLEIRNSIAHLLYSNDQLRPFAFPEADGPAADPECADAIRENDAVIERMAERIALIRAEVEARGASWDEFRAEGEHWADGTFEAGTIRARNGDEDDDEGGLHL